MVYSEYVYNANAGADEFTSLLHFYSVSLATCQITMFNYTVQTCCYTEKL